MQNRTSTWAGLWMALASTLPPQPGAPPICVLHPWATWECTFHNPVGYPRVWSPSQRCFNTSPLILWFLLPVPKVNDLLSTFLPHTSHLVLLLFQSLFLISFICISFLEEKGKVAVSDYLRALRWTPCDSKAPSSFTNIEASFNCTLVGGLQFSAGP